MLGYGFRDHPDKAHMDAYGVPIYLTLRYSIANLSIEVENYTQQGVVYLTQNSCFQYVK
jgi:hypothetical protein